MTDATEVDAAVERLEPSNTHYMTGEEHARALLKTIPKGADQSEITFTLTGFDIAKFLSSFDALSAHKAVIDELVRAIQLCEDVEIDYTNWRGERSTRLIVPVSLHYGHNEWHSDDQALLRAYDGKKNNHRDFAVKDIHAIARAQALKEKQDG